MSYARFSAPTIETSAAELLHKRARDTEREQSAVLVICESSHLLLDQLEDLRRNERAERATDVVSDVREGKKLASASRNRMAGNRARKK